MRTVNSVKPGENPLFGDYVALLDGPQRELVRAAFMERAGAVCDERVLKAYLALAEAVPTIRGGEDVDIRALCRGVSSAGLAAEKLHWGSRVDRSVRIRAADGSPAGPAHPPRPHPLGQSLLLVAEKAP